MSFLKKLFSSKKEEFQQPEILLEEKSPNCPITAIVEQDNRVAYLYLWGPENSSFGVKSCWVRNLKEAPDQKEESLMKKGIAPMLPKQFCAFPSGQPKLDKEKLHLIWFEEGDGVALFENEELLAVIPAWGGMGGFSGYAKDCTGQSDFCWGLPKTTVIQERIEKSKEFWSQWDAEVNPFQKQQPFILNTYEEVFGKSDKYYAIDGDEGPPKGLYLRKGESKTVFATVGLSLLPQPVVEMYTENRFDLNRIELGIAFNSVFSEDEIQKLAEWVSGQSAIPWSNITFLGEGHTINFPPLSSKFCNVLLTNKVEALPKINLGTYRESKINFLWMIPISDRERQEVIEKGSNGLIEKLNKIGDQIFSLERNEVVELR